MLSEGRSRRSDFGCLIALAMVFSLSLALWALFVWITILLWGLLA